jgi:hypothetical protein
MTRGRHPDAYFRFTHGECQRSLASEKEDILEGKIDSLMQRLEKMDIEKKRRKT